MVLIMDSFSNNQIPFFCMLSQVLNRFSVYDDVVVSILCVDTAEQTFSLFNGEKQGSFIVGFHLVSEVARCICLLVYLVCKLPFKFKTGCEAFCDGAVHLNRKTFYVYWNARDSLLLCINASNFLSLVFFMSRKVFNLEKYGNQFKETKVVSRK